MRNFLPEGWRIDTPNNKYMISTPSTVYEAMNRGEILEARATMCDFEHNLIVELGCMRGIIPREEGAMGIKEGTVKDIALISRVGKPVCFVVDTVKPDENGKLCAYLSRRRAQEICVKEHLKQLTCGDVISARVTHLEAFGAFCDIGCGIIALMPIDAISISRITHPSDRFSVGRDIKAVIRNIDENMRITLSQKELLGTWVENASSFMQGQTVTGIVRSVEEYGIFIELTPNLAGLAESREGVKVGQKASVYIKSLNPEKMKVKLIIIDTFDEDIKTEWDYFFSGEHIDYWKYSPDCSRKIVETDFG